MGQATGTLKKFFCERPALHDETSLALDLQLHRSFDRQQPQHT